MMFPLIRWFRARWGHDKYSAETFDRLMQSMHVADLRWLASVTTSAALVVIAAIAIIAYLPRDGLPVGSKFYEILVPFQISAVLAGLGGIIAWCYQTGSARLGIVDLFACEITTLCRISTIKGLTDTCIEAFEADAAEHDKITRTRARFSHFDSLEAYTPIFDANTKELRNLSVKVLTNITAFYTYWKATRDAFRRLANTPATTTNAPPDGAIDPWQRAMRDVIYMHFLACESARRAIRDLVEFEPNRAENTITILLSELPAYRFLLKYFREDDDRHARLELRRDRYRIVVAQVCDHTEGAYAEYNDVGAVDRKFRHLARENLEELRRDWDKSYRMLKELKSRYEAVFGEFPDSGAVAA